MLEYSSQPQFDPFGFFIVREISSGLPVATAFAWHAQDQPTIGKLHWVAVDPDYQKRGFATYLVGVVLSHFFNHGVLTVQLSTESYRTDAIRIYERFSFALISDAL